jgi:toxin ParE1/3/4
MRIEWTRSAARDVRNVRNYIALDSEVYAERTIEKIVEAVEKAANFPRIGRKVPEADDDSIREIIFGNYRIIYRIEESRILVLMVIHGARDLTQVVPKPWEVE